MSIRSPQKKNIPKQKHDSPEALAASPYTELLPNGGTDRSLLSHIFNSFLVFYVMILTDVHTSF